MPITSFASYRPTTQEFSVNWDLANTETGATPIVLAGAYAHADFLTDRTDLMQWLDLVDERALNARQIAAMRDQAKFNFLTRAKQFRGEVQGQITDASYLRELPPAPRLGADYDKFSQPLRAIARLWARINNNATALGLSGPLTLAGGYTQAAFQSDLTELAARYEASEAADGLLAQTRGERTNKAKAIYQRMLQYRKLAPARLPKNSPALSNLPRLTPAPGTTPPPLTVTGVWDQQITNARLTWTASTAQDVEKLQVRGCTGGSFKAENEEIIADLPAAATHWEGDWGLTVPGAIASFKIYVMTTTGNENGGKAVKIVRPET